MMLSYLKKTKFEVFENCFKPGYQSLFQNKENEARI